MLARICFNLFLNVVIYFLKLPSIPLRASFLDLSVLLLIISITASASVKSILPFKNALLVNSPGSAFLAPFSCNSSNILSVGETPP